MKPFSLNLRGILHEYTRPTVMGVINVTTDSFYGASRARSLDEIRSRAEDMVAEGADFIDIGAYSTRPSCSDVPVPLQQEVDALCEGISAVHKIAADTPISVDTFRAEAARVAIEQGGADIINDISGGNFDPEMFVTVARLGVPYILTHSLGSDIGQMHKLTADDVISDVVGRLADKAARLQLYGVNDIIIDPGFGFSKTVSQNYHLLANLHVLQTLHLPILVGVSRKSMVTKPLDITPEEALTATTVINTIAVQQGASILRVHDVKAAHQTLKILDLVSEAHGSGAANS